MTRAKDISKIIIDADFSGTLDVAGNLTISGTSNFQNDITLTGASIAIADNEAVRFGAGQDLAIFHDGVGGGSYINEQGTGDLNIQAADILFKKYGTSEVFADFNADGAVELYYDASKKFETTSTGIDVTGTIEADDKITIAYEAGSSDWELESTSGDDFTISRNGSQKLLIDGSTSNVGIGTSSPADRLHIVGSNGATSRTSFNGYTQLILENNSDTSIDISTGNTHAGFINFHDTDGLNRGQIAYGHTSDVMTFGTAGSERMRISSNGEVGINKVASGAQLHISSSDMANIRDALKLQNAANNTGGYFIRFLNSSNGIAGYVEHTGTSTVAYRTSSDHRLKENVVTMTGAIDRVKQLLPKRFNFIDDDTDTVVDGFLAHEAQTVVPEAVGGTHNEVEVWKDGEELPDGVSVGDNKLDEDGNTIPIMQGIDQSKLVPLLTGALKEAIAKIEALETRIEALENA